MKTCSLNESKHDESQNSVKIFTKSFHLKNGFHEQIKNCLRICSIADWKKDLIKSSVNNMYQNSNMFYNDLSCVNNLGIKSSLEQFGIALLPSSDGSNEEHISLQINYYTEFMSQLFSDCYKFEIMFKYTVSFRKINRTSDINKIIGQNLFEQVVKIKQFCLNDLIKDDYFLCVSTKETSLESSLELKLERNFLYEINVFVQTPFDARPYHIGAFLLNDTIKINSDFIAPNHKKMILKENPFIFSNYWSECVSNNFIFVSFYKELVEETNFDSINYLLFDASKIY